MRLLKLAAACLLATSSAAVSQGAPALPQGTSAIDPRAWRSEIAGPPTQILTIGSAHLQQIEPLPTAPLLADLIDRLVAFRPDMVTVEGVSGEQCEQLTATPDIYDKAADSYCWDAGPVQRESGLTGAGARIAIDAALRAWPASPTPAQRRRLASLFIASNDRGSALVQWLQLPAAEQRAGDGITPMTLAVLTTAKARMSEIYALAAVVAARLGHLRLYPVDDHASDAVLAAAPPTCDGTIQAMWARPEVAAMKVADDAQQARAGANSAAMLGFYRYLNAPETQRTYIDIDHRAAVGSGGAGDCGRRYVAWWETRNLRMAANIRAAMGTRPGGRILNIVGASHKPYYDLYLSQMADAVVLDAGAALR